MNIKEKANEYTRIEQQELLRLQIELHIDKLMIEQNVNYEELAKRLGKKTKYVKNLFNGKNFTIDEISDVLLALDAGLIVDTGHIGFHTTIKPEAS